MIDLFKITDEITKVGHLTSESIKKATNAKFAFVAFDKISV
jgi:hypothetical protein